MTRIGTSSLVASGIVQVPNTPSSLLRCPCCGIERTQAEATSLIACEDELRSSGADPWKRDPLWTLESAKSGQLQWACDQCISQGKAFRAHPERQNFCDHLPYLAYFDTFIRCRDCASDFLFSSSEQRHWYEELRFLVQSRPIRCLDCRRRRRAAKERAR
jgi:hypothetical protein